MILYELMKVVTKKLLPVSILLLHNNVCIKFVTYKFCYSINNVCINCINCINIRRGGRPGDVQEGAESRPHCAGKLWTTITRYGGRYAKTLNPASQQGLCAVCGGNRSQRNDFGPAGCAVDHGEHIGHARRVWQRAYQVYMQVCKPAVRDWNVLWLQMHVSVSLSTLTA